MLLVDVLFLSAFRMHDRAAARVRAHRKSDTGFHGAGRGRRRRLDTNVILYSKTGMCTLSLSALGHIYFRITSLYLYSRV